MARVGGASCARASYKATIPQAMSGKRWARAWHAAMAAWTVWANPSCTAVTNPYRVRVHRLAVDAERLPDDVRTAMSRFLTAELTTVSRAGVPHTWPVLPSIEWESGRIVVATSIGLPQKAHNIRRHPGVCLLFSDSTGSGLVDVPSVLVEGRAEVSERIIASFAEIEDPAMRAALERDAVGLLRRQPAVRVYAGNRLTRALMDWYFLRLLIVVTAARISWGGADRRQWESLDVA